MSAQEFRTPEQKVVCKRHVWDVVGESKPVLVRSNISHRYYRWYVPVKCARCGMKKTRPA